MSQYYWSTDDRPFEVIIMTSEMEHNHYPIVVTPPDPSLKSPKYDWQKGGWVENDVNSQAQQISELKNSMTKLNEKIDSIDKAETEVNSVSTKIDALQQQLLKTTEMLAAVAFPKMNGGIPGAGMIETPHLPVGGVGVPGAMAKAPAGMQIPKPGMQPQGAAKANVAPQAKAPQAAAAKPAAGQPQPAAKAPQPNAASQSKQPDKK